MKKYQHWTDEELDFLFENYKYMSYKELSKELNRSVKSLYGKCYRLGITPRYQNEYALYNGDELIVTGTMKEITEFTGLKRNTINNYLWHGTRGNTTVIKLEDEE